MVVHKTTIYIKTVRTQNYNIYVKTVRTQNYNIYTKTIYTQKLKYIYQNGSYTELQHICQMVRTHNYNIYISKWSICKTTIYIYTNVHTQNYNKWLIMVGLGGYGGGIGLGSVGIYESHTSNLEICDKYILKGRSWLTYLLYYCTIFLNFLFLSVVIVLIM